MLIQRHRCCDEKEEVTVEAPTYDYYDQTEILDQSDEEEDEEEEDEEEEEGSQRPELGARVQVQLGVGSFASKTSTAFCLILSPPTCLLLLSTLTSSCHFLSL